MAAICNRCGMPFTRKSNLRRHQNESCKGSPPAEEEITKISPPTASDVISAVINDGIELAPTVTKKRKLEQPVATRNEYDALYDPPSSNVRFLPETINDLANRFNELFPKYWASKEPNSHNELVSLLDELLHQHGITHEIYKKMNDLLSTSIGHGIDDGKDEREELEKKVIDIVEYLIRHDRSEIEELLNAFQGDELFEDDVNRLEQLVDKWIADEIQGKQLSLDDIEQILRKLTSSSIPRSKLHRFEMLLKDIRSNRFRVYDIIHRMNPILSDPNRTPQHVSDCLKSMLREGFISGEQFKSLNKKIKDLDLENVISEIKSVKVGRGVDFLPREAPDLLKKLKEWSMEFAKYGTAVLRQKILSVLDELLFRKVITNKEHKDIKEDSKVEQIS
jgi:hypothetical protein